MVGAALVLLAIACVVRIAYIYVRYPGLTDPLAGPVHYWPELDVMVGSVFAVLFALAGIPTLLVSAFSYRRQRDGA